MSGAWALVQARMGSTRFPGKVLTPLAGKPIIDHLLERLGRCPGLAGVAVLTSLEPGDDALAAHCQARGVRVFRGPLDDVLERYRLACQALRPDAILRITGDAPLVDTDLAAACVAAVARHRGPAMSRGVSSRPTAHEGCDAINAAALDVLFAHGDDPIAREHVTSWFKYHPDLCAWADVAIPDADCTTLKIRTSVDTPADLAFLEEAHRRLGIPAGALRVAELIALVEREPELLEINRHVHQKGAAERARRALVVTEAGATAGFGHVVRATAIAEQLRDGHGFGLVVALLGDGANAPLPAQAPLLPIADPQPGWLAALLAGQRPDVVVIDLPRALAPADAAALRAFPGRSCAVDTAQAWREAVSDAFYVPVPSAGALAWATAGTIRHVGWEWMPLRRGFAAGGSAASGDGLLIALGASQAATRHARSLAHAAAACLPAGRITVMLAHPDDAGGWPAGCILAVAPADPAAVLRAAQVAVLAFGTLAYEAAALAVPAIVLAWTDDHAASQAAFCAAGFAVDGGMIGPGMEARTTGALRQLLADAGRRRQLAERCRAVHDGRGAARIAAILASPRSSP